MVASWVRARVREARSAASSASLRSFSAFRRAFSARSAAALRSASALAFLASWAAFWKAACSRVWRLWSRASCWDASAEAATALARFVPASSEPRVGISMVSVTGSAFAGPAAPATAMVPRTPPATPARSASFEALRRGFRWLGM